MTSLIRLHPVIVAALFLYIASAGQAHAQPEEGPDDGATTPVDADESGLEDSAVGVDPAGGDRTAGDVSAAAIPPAVTEPVASDTIANAGYDKGFFIVSDDGKFKLKTQGRVQGRYTFETIGQGDANESAFSIPRARLTLGGHAFSKDINYKFQTDFGKGNLSLKDFIVDYRVGSGETRIRVGQYKRPFSRQQINSSGRLELVDRAITDKAFGAGRDIGVMIHNNYEKSPEIEWAVGLFNGTGDKASLDVETDAMGNVIDVGGFSNVPDLFGPALVMRAGYNAGGIKGYSEADLEGGPLRFGVAANVLAEFDADGDDASSVRAGADFIAKASGLSATGGVYIATVQDDTSFTDQTYDRFGFHLQLGYMVSKEHQVAGRFAMIAAEADTGDQMEATVGYSMYSYKHNFKWQTDVGMLSAGGSDLPDDILVRSQLQLSF